MHVLRVKGMYIDILPNCFCLEVTELNYGEERRVMNTLDPVDSLSKYREQSFSERS